MLRITDNYTLPTLCGAPHNVCNEEGIAERHRNGADSFQNFSR